MMKFRAKLLVILNRGAINGATRQLSLWLPALASELFETRVIFLRDRGPMGDAIVPKGARSDAGFLSWRWDLLGALRVLFAANSWRPDIVLSIDERNASFLSRLTGLITGAAVVNAVHSSPRQGLKLPLWNRVTLSLVDLFIAVSATQRELLVSIGFPEEKVSVVYNGVPVREGCLSAERGGLEVVALFAGVLRQDKRVDLLLSAMERVKIDAPNLSLLVAGGGDCEEELKRLAEELGVSGRVTWLGWCGNLGPVLAKASFLVLPSDCGVETLSMSVLEAMAYGLPVVCTDVGSMREAVDAEVGIVVPPGDVDALAGAMLQLYQDTRLRQRMGNSAKSRQERLFSAVRMREEIEQTLIRLIDWPENTRT